MKTSLFSIMRVLMLLAMILAVTGSLSVQAQQATQPVVLDLSDLIRTARENNPALRVAQTQALAAATRPAQVTSLPDPTVSVGYRPFGVRGVDGVFPTTVSAQQMIPYPGKLQLAGKAASYAAEMSAHEAEAMAQDVVYEIKDAYYELYRIQEQDRLIRSFQQQLEGFAEAAAVKYEVGSGMQQSILKAQLEKSTLSRKLLDLTAMRRELLERLARLTGQPTLAAASGAITLQKPEIVPVSAPALEAALRARPEIAALQAGVQMSEAEIEMARKEYKPDFMVGIGIMDEMGMGGAAKPLDNLGSRIGIEAGLVIPLRKGKRDAAVQEAQLRRQEYEQRIDDLRLQIETEINSYRARMEEDSRALKLFTDTLVPQAQTTLEATLSAYTTGRTDFLDLLDAERMLFDLQMEYEETYASYVKARSGLERTLGVESLQLASSTSETTPAASATQN